MTIMLFTFVINTVVWCQENNSIQQLGTVDSDGFNSASVSLTKSTVQSATAEEIYTIEDAADLGLINSYCYVFDGDQNQPVSTDDDEDPITPWTGFWIVVKENLDILYPEFDNPPTAPTTMTFDVEPTRFYLIAFPLFPAYDKEDWPDSADINVNIGDDLGDGEYEEKWRVTKWDYDSKVYTNYTGPGTLVPIFQGTGYYLQHIHPEGKTIDISGLAVGSTGTPFQLKFPSNGDPYTYHMTGNPFWYDIYWKDFKVRVPMDAGLWLPKPAVVAEKTIESWHIGLKLESFDGKARDTYNRAGVILTSGVDPKLKCAFDLIPPGDFIRLVVKDPSNPDRVPYSYDYRAKNQDEYMWQVELTTTYTDINTKFKLDNIDSVPENYVVTLRNSKSGEVYEINEDETFDIVLASGETETFILMATRIQSDVNEEEIIPEAFGITDIRPNPFNPSTTISYFLDRPGNVTVTIFNVNGQLIETIVDGYSDHGFHNVMWNAKDNATGIYGVSVVSDERRDFRKITLIK